MITKTTIKNIFHRAAGMMSGARRKISALLVMMLTMTAQTAWAGEGDQIVVDCNGEGQYKSIFFAVNAATGGETIFIKNGVYNETYTIKPSKSLTIKGESQAGVMIKGPSSSPLFAVKDGVTISISNLTITGVIYVDDDNTKLTIDNTTISNVEMPAAIGVIVVNEGTVAIKASTIKDNKLTGDGSCIIYNNNGTITIESTTFNHNIYDDGITKNNNSLIGITVTDCTFVNNEPGTSSGTTNTPGTSTTQEDPSISVASTNIEVHSNPGKAGEYWCTYYHPTNNMKIKTQNVEIYKAKYVYDGPMPKVTLKKVNGSVINAGQAVMLKATTAEKITLEQTTESLLEYEYEDNDLKGGSTMPTDYFIYTLSAGADSQGPMGFYLFDGSLTTPATTLDPNKAHLEVPKTLTGARSFVGFDEGETTSLREVKSVLRQAQGPSDEVWYSLDGRRLSALPTQKGVYVKDGRKYVVK